MAKIVKLTVEAQNPLNALQGLFKKLLTEGDITALLKNRPKYRHMITGKHIAILKLRTLSCF